MKNLIILKGKKVIFSFIAVFLVTSAALAEDSIIKIGVLAKRGPERCIEKWSPTAEYLNNKIPEKTFVIVPVDFDQIYSVVEKSEVDFILMNSSFYVELESWYKVNRIATLKNKVLAGIYTKYGGAVFCKKQREDIRQYGDLKGKTFMAVEKTSFGGWRMAWRELKEAGIDPFKDFASMSFGGTHDAVVYAVRDGKVDVGTVRTDTLERMNAEGKIKIDDFYIIHEHGGGNVHLPFLHSTREYPEWPIAKLKHTSNEVAEKVAVALIGMPQDSAAAQAARCTGWTIPLNYQSVRDCLKELKVGPYKDLGKITLTDIFRKYWILILIDLATIVVLAWFLAAHIILNRKINTAHKQLELEVKERIQTEELFRKERDKVLAYLDIAGVIIVVLNNDQSVAVINKKGREILGYDESEIIGKKWLDNFLPEKDRDQTRTVFSELLAGNIEPVKYYENYILTKDNKERLIAWNNSVLRDDEGKIVATLSSGEDITERKQVEAELRLKKQVFETAITANSTADNKGILTHVNKTFIKTWGYENNEEAVGKPIGEFLKFEDEAKKIITALNEAGKWKGEYTALKKDGTTFTAYALSTMIKDASGKVIGYQSAVLDISEQKLAEDALLESERFLQDVFNAIGDGISVLDLDLKIIRTNSWMEKMYSREGGLAGNMCYEVYQNRDTPCPWCPSLKTIKTGEPNSATVPYPSEENPIGWIDLSSFPLNNAEGDLIGVIEYVKDITQQMKLQSELKEANDIINRSQVVAFLWKNTEAWPVEFVSENVKELFGYSAEDFTSGKVSYVAVVHPDDIKRVTEEVSNFSKDVRTKEFVHEPYRIITKSRTVKYVDDRTYIRRDNKGEITHYEGVVIDITDRILAEKSLKESHETFLAVLDGIDSEIYVADMETYKILFMNKAMKDIFGADFTGKICWEVLRNESGPCGHCTKDKLLDEEGNPAGVQVWDDQNPITGRWHINYDRAIKWMDGYYVRLQVATDITDLKKMEEQLHQAQKMEAVGTLAGGVAHDFNNMLTTIIGNAQLALNDISKDDSLRKQIEEIVKAGQRSASLTRQLLAFSRKQVIKPEVLDLNNVINETEKMLKRMIAEDVEFQTVLKPELWKVHMDSGQVDQIIINLAVNARDAMPQGGKLIVETANVDLDKNYLREHGIEGTPGHYVMLAISDIGSGMDKETQEHIFEPFFTTKEIGKGTGLGLSTVYGIAKQNNGFIWVYSEPGHGTTFKIYLPKVKGDAEAEEKKRTPVGDLNGSETVLIVEDDDSLRKLTRKILERYGYSVQEAENGEDALRVSEAYDGSIHLMLTDVVMPKMSGRETAERLQPLYPKMKVIYMSGYTDNAIAHHGVLDPGLNFLEKPFAPGVLARKVREVLDK